MATARPPSVMVLIPRPTAWKTMKVVSNDRGIAVKVIAVVRKLSRKMKSTTATMRLPSRKASSTLRTARAMKLL